MNLICIPLAIVALAAPPAPWELSGWSHRAVVTIDGRSDSVGCDTAGVKVLCQGRARADGADYRVLDASGAALPFQVLFHDAARYSLIAFRADASDGPYHVYFGNPSAERAAEQVTADSAAGAGPPTGDWMPRFGLTLTTLTRPKVEVAAPRVDDNPETVEELAAMLAAAPAVQGARWQRRISDGYNPFGSSDMYLSVYRGWMHIPADGTYQFCTASNEASFSFIDGRALVHWPGRHTEERGARGEKNATVDLTAGPHYVEYYHEEVFLQQVAFLGWRPPGAAEGIFGAIPEDVFTTPHTATVNAYDAVEGPAVTFEPVIVDSLWPEERADGQYTRARFRAMGIDRLPADTALHWSFGDGLSATGSEVEHVYLALGHYHVTLSTAPGGAPLATWPLDVYEIQHVTDEIAGGNVGEYATIARAYDRQALAAVALRELAHVLADGDDPAAALEVGRLWIERFAATTPETAPRVRRLMAECSLRLGDDGLDEAIANFQASMTEETPPAERFDVLARLIRLLAIEREQPDKAGEVLGQVEQDARGAKMDEETRAAYRRAVIAGGDALLWHGKTSGARDIYRRVEQALSPKIPSQVRGARIGAYPGAIRELIAAGDQGAALDLVREWEETFPTEKLHGQTFYWRGKLQGLAGQHRDAARLLARAIGLGQGAAYESEARWLLAGELEALDRPGDARKELAKLVASGANDEFAQMAAERLGDKRPNGD
jgi:hypothetical protein